ncbi:MAG: glycoside hydrolase domain-containing protein [Thermoguttaceae bacterium]
MRQLRLAHLLPGAVVFILVLCPVMARPSDAAEPDQRLIEMREKNQLANPGFEEEGGWVLSGKDAKLDTTVARSGRRSLRLSNQSLEDSSRASQVLRFDPPVKHPFRISGWSRAQDVEVIQDYDIFLDLEYADGTPLWGQVARFTPGTHDWQQAELVFDVAKPVREIKVFVFLRKGKGTVWFDDLEVGLAPFAYRALRVMPNVFGAGTLGVFGTTTMPARWRATLEGPGGQVGQTEGQEMPIRFDWINPSAPAGDYTLRLSATDGLLGQTVEHRQAVALKPTTEPSRGFAVWTETSMRRVSPYDMPPEDKSRLDAPEARISLAGHEYESFQVALLSGGKQRLEDVEIELGDLVCAANGGRIAKEHLQWQQVGYVHLSKLRQHPADPLATAGWWPEVLLPAKKFSVEPGFAQAVWVTVYAPAGTPAGQYAGKLTVRPKNAAPAEVQIQANVYGFALPVRGHMKTAFALMDGYLEKIYGKPLSAELRQKYGDFVLSHRLNPDDISRTSPPAIEDLEHYKDAGLNTFNVLNMVEERGNRIWVCYSNPPVYTPEFKQRLIERLDPYMAEIRARGLLDRAYIHGFDEREKDFFPIIAEYFGMAKQRYPGLHTLTTAKIPLDPKAMREVNVDWNCPLTPRYRLEDADRCRQAGLEIWAYVCMGPGYPYANWLANHPLVESRVIWWQTYEQKMDGFLYWGVNIWSKAYNDRPIDPSAGPRLDWSITTGGAQYEWLHGDGVLLYPGPKGPIGSIRLANIRDGLEDYEYLWLLSQQTGDKEQARAACRPVTTNLTTYTRDPDVLLKQRDVIARQLAK